MHYPSTIAVFLAARGLLASAAPAVSPVDLLPRDIALLAVDDSGKLVNYGAGGKAVPVGDDVKATNGTTKSAPGAKLGDKKTKRGPASTCVPLTKEDLEKLPAWKIIEAQAKKNWGKGKYRLVLNPKEYGDRPALVCIGKEKSMIAIKGKPDCTSSAQTSDGKLVGTDGTVKLTQQDGTSASTTTTVTKEATVGVGSTVGVEMGSSAFGKATFERSFHIDITNTLANAKTAQSSNMKSHEIMMKAPKGKKCHMEYTSTTCTGKGEGVVNYTAQGYVWFNYHSKTKGHYKWAIKIEDAVSKISDRSSQMLFQATVKSTTNTRWNGKCK